MTSAAPGGPGDMTDTSSRLLSDSPAFSGFSVDDLDAARSFYTDVLGLRTSGEPQMGGIMHLHLAGGRDVLVYAKGAAHSPASYTVLNFPVPDVDAAVAELSARGVEFLHYDSPPTDETGVMRAGGPLIAWFTDPAGNVFSVIEQS
jgi:catechol 2,3-dioxygenase-like lactoylglutathione lyase family enzyme